MTVTFTFLGNSQEHSYIMITRFSDITTKYHYLFYHMPLNNADIGVPHLLTHFQLGNPPNDYAAIYDKINILQRLDFNYHGPAWYPITAFLRQLHLGTDYNCRVIEAWLRAIRNPMTQLVIGE